MVGNGFIVSVYVCFFSFVGRFIRWKDDEVLFGGDGCVDEDGGLFVIR